MTKKNDYGGLLLLGGIVLIGYLMARGGIFGQYFQDLFGGATSGGGSAGGGGGGTSPTQPPFSPPNTIPAELPPVGTNNPQQITIGLLAPKPILNKVQPYGFVGVDKNNQYIQRAAPLTTTPAMSNPAIVQARGIISQTANIDVGAIVNTIRATRKTYSSPSKVSNIVAPAKALIQKTSGINVNNLIQILKAKPVPITTVKTSTLNSPIKTVVAAIQNPISIPLKVNTVISSKVINLLKGGKL